MTDIDATAQPTPPLDLDALRERIRQADSQPPFQRDGSTLTTSGELRRYISDEVPAIIDEVERLRYERRLLGMARRTLDLVAEGHNHGYTVEMIRNDAADVAQRIVDEIGHPVTDEPALGPGFREEIAKLTAERDAAREEAAKLRTVEPRLHAEVERCRRSAAVYTTEFIAGLEYAIRIAEDIAHWVDIEPQADALTWRDYTVHTGGADTPSGVVVVCRSVDECDEGEYNERGRHLTLGEAVDWAKRHAAEHAKGEVEDEYTRLCPDGIDGADCEVPWHRPAPVAPASAEEACADREWDADEAGLAAEASDGEQEVADRLTPMLDSSMVGPNAKQAITNLMGDGVHVAVPLRQKLIEAVHRGLRRREDDRKTSDGEQAAPCGWDGCEEPATSWGLCARHFNTDEQHPIVVERLARGVRCDLPRPCKLHDAAPGSMAGGA